MEVILNSNYLTISKYWFKLENYNHVSMPSFVCHQRLHLFISSLVLNCPELSICSSAVPDLIDEFNRPFQIFSLSLP